MTGKIYANLAGRVQPSNNFTDWASEGGLWTASLGLNGVRALGSTNDIGILDRDPVFGLYEIAHSQNTAINTFGTPVRCMEDPNKDLLGNFETDYFSINQFNYTTGINNPNSYIIGNNQATLNIPMSKAFAMYNQYLTDHGWPVGDFNASVVWATSNVLIKKVSVTAQNESGNVVVEFGANNPRGNAVVALKDGQNKVLWSWHIWASETTPTPSDNFTTESVIPNASNLVNPTKSGMPPLTTIFMDRNLGALQAFPTVANAAAPPASEIQQISKSGGMLYQWGRKDPIPSFYNPNNSITMYSIYTETAKDGNGNSLYGANGIVDYSKHVSDYSIPYEIYGTVVSATDPIQVQIRNVLKYAVENPGSKNPT